MDKFHLTWIQHHLVMTDAAILGVTVMLILLLATAPWRAKRRVAREWSKLNMAERSQLKTEFLEILIRRSGQSLDPVPISDVKNDFSMPNQLLRIRQQLDSGGWTVERTVTGGLLRTLASAFNSSISSTEEAVALTGPGLESMKVLLKNSPEHLTVGETPRTLFDEKHEEKSVNYYINGPISHSQLNFKKGKNIQNVSGGSYFGSSAAEFLDILEADLPGSTTMGVEENLRTALLADGSATTASQNGSHTSNWIRAAQEQLPPFAVGTVIAALKQWMGFS